MSQSATSTPTPGEGTKGPTVCVFCAASPGSSPSHLEAARSLARALHSAGATLVYGGGTVGLMGELAKTLVSLSGPESVHGIIPDALLKLERRFDASNGEELQQTPLAVQRIIDEKAYGRTTVVKDMHGRKQRMAREVIEGGPGSGFVALSGGYGTLEELMEIVTWNQLGIHSRPVVVFNVDGYWDGLLQWVNTAVQAGFIVQRNKDIMVEAKTADDVISELRDYRTAEGRFDLQWGEK